MITFAICDDESQMAREIADHLAAYLKEKQLADHSIHLFSDGNSLLEGGSFDVIFLDIQMAPPNGMETARLLRQRGDRSLLIFVTVLKECVFDAFEVEACDYLIKPLDSSRFRQRMDRIIRALEQRSVKTILIQKGLAQEVVSLSEVLYCEVLGRKVYLHQSGGAVTDYYDRLDKLERRLDRRFFRCHRSYLVNLDHVHGVRAGQVTLSSGEKIPVSRLRERDLTQALLCRMKGNDL